MRLEILEKQMVAAKQVEVEVTVGKKVVAVKQVEVEVTVEKKVVKVRPN